jgi:hypothetical protein
MDESDLEVFRTRTRLRLLEHLTIKTAFAFYIKVGGLSVEQTQRTLKEYLDAASTETDRVYGEVLRDPGPTAIFADEAKDVAEKMKVTIDQVANDAVQILRPWQIPFARLGSTLPSA